MGSGFYDDDAVAARVDTRCRSGLPSVASYTAKVSSGAAPKACHPDLSPFGVKVRESRDSADHPESNPVILVLDETGSMGAVINAIQKSLKPLMGLLIRKGYLPDPQIMIMAVGDEFTGEVAPLQASQFESDDRIEQNLDNILIEGNGGGQNRESYQNAAYFIARHTVTDAWEKRGKKGYVFIFGDELNHPIVDKEKIAQLIGDNLEASLSLQRIYEEMHERWNVFFVLPKNANNGGNPAIKQHWADLIGAENVIDLSDENTAAETVAVQIGLCEGTTDTASFAKDITDLHGAGAKSTEIVRAVSASVRPIAGGGAITKVATGALEPSTPPAIERM